MILAPCTIDLAKLEKAADLCRRISPCVHVEDFSHGRSSQEVHFRLHLRPIVSHLAFASLLAAGQPFGSTLRRLAAHTFRDRCGAANIHGAAHYDDTAHDTCPGVSGELGRS